MSVVKLWKTNPQIIFLCVFTRSYEKATAIRTHPAAFIWRFWHSEDRASWNIRIIEAIKMHYFSTLFWYTTLHVSDGLTVHHQESWYCINSNHTIHVVRQST
jgi:hypothetical protein